MLGLRGTIPALDCRNSALTVETRLLDGSWGRTAFAEAEPSGSASSRLWAVVVQTVSAPPVDNVVAPPRVALPRVPHPTGLTSCARGIQHDVHAEGAVRTGTAARPACASASRNPRAGRKRPTRRIMRCQSRRLDAKPSSHICNVCRTSPTWQLSGENQRLSERSRALQKGHWCSVSAAPVVSQERSDML